MADIEDAQELQKKDVDGLISCLDDLPLLLGRVKNETLNTSRYQIHGPNYSYNVGMALNGQDQSSRNAYQNKRLAFQAKKVLEKLQTLPEHPSLQKKSVAENAKAAKETLLKFKKSGIDLNSFYKQYDTTKSGNLTYKDFSDILLSMSTGIGREDAMFLASNIDRNKTGYIQYDNLVNALEKVENTQSSTLSSSNVSSSRGKTMDYSYSNADDISKSSFEEKKISPSTTFNRISPTASSSSSSSKKKKEEPLILEPVDPQHATRIYSLDPNNKSHVEAEEFTEMHNGVTGTGRRFYYDAPQTATTSRLKERTQPYYVDQSIDEMKAEKRNKQKRSSSAPPRSSSANTSLLTYVTKLESKEESTSQQKQLNISISDDLDLSNSTSLKRALASSSIKKNKSDNKPQLQLENPLTKLRSTLTERSTGLLEKENKILENNILTQIKGKYNNLKFIMSQQDRSKSGKINLQEFKRSLARLGVQLTQQQMEKLFATYLPNNDSNESSNNNNINRKNIEKHFYYNHQANTQFFNTSSININDKEKSIDIHQFITSLEERAKSSLFQHVAKDIDVNGKNLSTFLNNNENLLISKKILNSINRIPEPEKIFSSLYPNHHGYLNSDQITNSLQKIGTNISSSEVNNFIENFPKGPNGEISLNEFHKKLMSTISNLEKENAHQKQSLYLDNNKRYNNRTFQSSIVLGDLGSEFETNYYQKRVNDFYSVKDSKEWSHLQKNLQKNYLKILKAFTNESESRKFALPVAPDPSNKNLLRSNNIANSVEEKKLCDLSIDDLQKKLIKEGVILGNDDYLRLQKQIYQKLHNENRLQTESNQATTNDETRNKINVEDFCEVVGIPVRRYPNTQRIELLDKGESQISDFGTFESSKRSIQHNSQSATSMYFETPNEVEKKYTGDQKRKLPQPIYMQSKDPSKFWEFVNSVDNPMKFPYPQPSLRPTKPLANSAATTLAHLNPKQHKRGIVAMDDNSVPYHAPKLTVEALMRQNNHVIGGKGPVAIKGGGSLNGSQNNSINLNDGVSKEHIIISNSPAQGVMDASNLSTPSGIHHHHRRGHHNHHKRSSSAPPRSLGGSQASFSGDDFDGYSSRTESVISNSDASQSQQDTSQSRSFASNRVNASDLSHHIAKWSNNTLAEYYMSKEKAILGGGPKTISGGGAGVNTEPTTVPRTNSNVSMHYESQDSTASPQSFTSVSTGSRGTFNFSKQPVTIRGGGGSAKNASIRDDINNTIKTGAANAPFATDL